MSKRLKKARQSINLKKCYTIDEAISFFTEDYFVNYRAKFDETAEFVMKLGVDVKKSDQMVRGVVTMPNGLGKEKKIAVIVDSSKMEEAKSSGADSIGGEDLIEKIKKGFLDFEACVATPSMMSKVSSIGKLLGPKGLMPNPKLGTVTDNIAAIVKSIKKGQVEFCPDKSGAIRVGIAKISFEAKKTKENLLELYNAVLSSRPTKFKGIYVQRLFLSCTHGPSIKLDLRSLIA